MQGCGNSGSQRGQLDPECQAAGGRIVAWRHGEARPGAGQAIVYRLLETLHHVVEADEGGDLGGLRVLPTDGESEIVQQAVAGCVGGGDQVASVDLELGHVLAGPAPLELDVPGLGLARDVGHFDIVGAKARIPLAEHRNQLRLDASGGDAAVVERVGFKKSRGDSHAKDNAATRGVADRQALHFVFGRRGAHRQGGPLGRGQAVLRLDLGRHQRTVNVQQGKGPLGHRSAAERDIEHLHTRQHVDQVRVGGCDSDALGLSQRHSSDRRKDYRSSAVSRVQRVLDTAAQSSRAAQSDRRRRESRAIELGAFQGKAAAAGVHDGNTLHAIHGGTAGADGLHRDTRRGRHTHVRQGAGRRLQQIELAPHLAVAGGKRIRGDHVNQATRVGGRAVAQSDFKQRQRLAGAFAGEGDNVVLGHARHQHIAVADFGQAFQRLLHFGQRGGQIQHRGQRAARAELDAESAGPRVQVYPLLLAGGDGAVDHHAALHHLCNHADCRGVIGLPAQVAIHRCSNLAVNQLGELVDVRESRGLAFKNANRHQSGEAVARARQLQVKGGVALQHGRYGPGRGHARAQRGLQIIRHHAIQRGAEIERLAQCQIGEWQQRVEAARVAQLVEVSAQVGEHAHQRRRIEAGESLQLGKVGGAQQQRMRLDSRPGRGRTAIKRDRHMRRPAFKCRKEGGVGSTRADGAGHVKAGRTTDTGLGKYLYITLHTGLVNVGINVEGVDFRRCQRRRVTDLDRGNINGTEQQVGIDIALPHQHRHRSGIEAQCARGTPFEYAE